MNTPTSDTPGAAVRNDGKRRRRMIAVTLLLLAALGTYGLWWALYARYFETTDDAYVAGNVVQMMPQVAGIVTAIQADDTEFVPAGKAVIELDRSDARVALEQAKAQLAQTVREVRTLFVNNRALSANLALRTTDLARARSDLARRQELLGTGAVSKEDVEHARSALQGAESALAASREQLASSRALTERTSIEQHPNVQRAAAQLQTAYLAWARTSLPAPISGYVAKRSVQVGQRVAAGTPLLSIVPLDALWVDANFKEVQIPQMRIGQPVTLHSDLYGSGQLYHGKVAGLAAGTGSAFALLPAQNASGNWIKVVQRVPVRITLDPKELAERPLRVGVSMHAKVDISQAKGTSLSGSVPNRTAPAFQTSVYENAGKEADALIAQIIAANRGAGPSDAKSGPAM